MVLLGEEEVLDLVGDGVVGVISKIWAGLVGGGVGGGALPAGDVNGVQMLGHHSDLHRVECTEGPGGGGVGLVGLESPPEFFG